MLTVIAEIICHTEQEFKTVLDSFHNIRRQVYAALRDAYAQCQYAATCQSNRRCGC